MEVLKLEKQIAEKQVNTIYFFRASQSKNWVPFWDSKSKMAVTPTEVPFTGDEDISCSVHKKKNMLNGI